MPEPELKSEPVGFMAKVFYSVSRCPRSWNGTAVRLSHCAHLPVEGSLHLPLLKLLSLPMLNSRYSDLQLLFERKNYTQPQISFGCKRRASKYMPLGNHLMASLWFLLQMLRDKHGSKYTILFSDLNILHKLIRSCHFHTRCFLFLYLPCVLLLCHVIKVQSPCCHTRVSVWEWHSFPHSQLFQRQMLAG
jgi:hypothetical protein